ncbi:diaminopimelate epimerase [Pseudovibrio sp. Tun.PSC04-5.I4]|uniref:diaminopimelate epimerase n=1 Tax=Pseudovibrio sp. Tun.PSC04-5.I4 TaxID=1798213 RepID=UPI00088BC3D9|nr:diaminopimelate epimerase [Pseudovibrio sp. Tun.PSC04-5.I4]SDR24468.1 diaminopimelate epimerase [Pseudovibrio sp. Tun.PSC04-5.I4]
MDGSELMTDMLVPFLKMNGLGNDFVVFDARENEIALTPEQIAAIGSRTKGIGFDQMITVEPTNSGAYAFMRIHNRDGSEVGACGNATRCIGRLLMDEAKTSNVAILTNAGLLIAHASDSETLVSVDMGVPRLEWKQIPLAEEFVDTRAIELQIGPIDAPVLHSPSVVNVGNPHAIFWVDDIETHDLERFGPLLECHPMFPEKANISLAQIIGENEIRLKVWERGVGLTRACGTAACATGVAAARTGRTARKCTVHLPGGPLGIEWREDNDHIIMTGETEIEFEGELNLNTLTYTKTASGDAAMEPTQ